MGTSSSTTNKEKPHVSPSLEGLFLDNEKINIQQSFASLSNNKSSITKDKFFALFENTIKNSEFVERLWIKFTSNNPTLEYLNFVNALATCLKKDRIEFYLSIFGEDQTVISEANIFQILSLDAQTWLNICNISEEENDDEEKETTTTSSEKILTNKLDLLNGVVKCIYNELEKVGPVTLASLKKWAYSTAINLGDGIVCAIQNSFELSILNMEFPVSFFTSSIILNSFEPYFLYLILPHTSKKEKVNQLVKVGQVPQFKASSSASHWQSWQPLYSSFKDGWSISRFCGKVLDYKSHSVFLVRESNGVLFGAFVSQEWKLCNNQFNTAPSSFLFQISPFLQVFSSTNVSSNHTYLSCTTAHSKGLNGLGLSNSVLNKGPIWEGCAFGGQLDFFRLKIEAEMNKGFYTLSDTTFKQGDLLKRSLGESSSSEMGKLGHEAIPFVVVGVECWGGGGIEAENEHRKKIERDMRLIMKMRKVNRSKMFGGGSIIDSNEVAQNLNLLELAGVHESHVKQADHVS